MFSGKLDSAGEILSDEAVAMGGDRASRSADKGGLRGLNRRVQGAMRLRGKPHPEGSARRLRECAWQGLSVWAVLEVGEYRVGPALQWQQWVVSEGERPVQGNSARGAGLRPGGPLGRLECPWAERHFGPGGMCVCVFSKLHKNILRSKTTPN